MSDENDPKGELEAPPVTGKKLKVVEAEKELSPGHLEDLGSSCIPEAYAKRAGLFSTNSAKVLSEALGWPWRNGGGGLMFPFVDYDSRKVHMTRVKPDRPRSRQGGNGSKRVVKYEQAQNTGALPYFGPGTIDEQRLADKSRPLIWAEGEKKTLLLDLLGYPVIGITGCHNWNDAKKNREGDGMVWAKDLKKYSDRFFAGRTHVICFDADSLFNENVLLAMRRLAGLLLEHKANGVRFVRIPPDEKDPEKGVGIDDYMFAHDEAALRDLLSKSEPIAPGEEIEPIAPKDPLLRLVSLTQLRGAKLGKKLRLPPHFEIRRDCSLWLDPPVDKPDAPQREVLPAVMLPKGLLVNGEEQRVEIAYFAAGKWYETMVDRRCLKGARAALEGLPSACAVDSNNAAFAVSWFSEYMRHNAHRMKERKFISECGWQWDGDEPVFLLDVPITRGKAKSSIVADSAGTRADALEALKPKGTFEGHRKALKRLFETDEVSAIIFLATLCAPLLRPLGAPNFAVHQYGESTTGKSTRSKGCATVYGDPRNGTWVGSWNTTSTAMETRASTLNHLPLFFDEVGAGDARAIEKSIYMLVNGEGRSRSNQKLSNVKPMSWQTVTISNGEHELASAMANTGIQVRLIQVRSVQFAGMTRADVDAMRADCDANAGQLGRVWIQKLVDIEDWGEVKDLFSAAKKLFDSSAKNGLMQRQSVYFALMAVAEHLAYHWFGIGEEGGGTVRRFVGSSTNRTEVESASERAIESLSAWVYSEPLSFPKLSFDSNGTKKTNISKGVKLVNGARDGKSILFLPNELRKRFDREGISYAEVLSGWRDAGHIECDSGKYTSRVRVDGSRTRFVVVKRDVLGIESVDMDGAQTEADFGD